MRQPASAAIAYLSIAPFNAIIIESVPESVRGVQYSGCLCFFNGAFNTVSDEIKLQLSVFSFSHFF
jgi:hypothetical protein